MTTVRLQLFRGASGIAALRDDWKQLCERTRAKGLMQVPEYYESYVEILCGEESAFIAAAYYHDEQLVAVLPLSVLQKRKFGLAFCIISFPDTPIPTRSFVAIDDLTIDDLVENLRLCFRSEFGTNWDVLRLTGYTDYEVGTDDQRPCPGDQNRKRIAKNNFIDLSSPDYITEVLSSNMRNNLTRRMKRLEKLGEYSFKTVDRFPDLNDAFDAFIETEAAGWKSRRGGKRAIKLHEDQLSFFQDLLARFASSGNCHIHLLNLGDNTIAADFVLLSGDAAYSLKHGYDETYSDVTPSNLLRKYTIDFYSALDSIATIDLISGYEWQNRWKPQSRPVFEIQYFNNTAKGVLLKSYNWLTTIRRRIVSK